MTPLRIRAHIRSQIALPNGPPALDSLLIALACEREGIPPPPTPQLARRDIPIPVAMEPGGRFHLASFGVYVPEVFENRFVNRRFPLDIAQDWGEPKLRTVRINGGSCKTYRLPLEVMHLAGDQILWFCQGDPDAIRALLSVCTSLGKKRGVGLGRVRAWETDKIEPWDGFPVVYKGQALRNLPPDWPGLVNPRVAMRVLSPPYTDKLREEPLATPSWMTEARDPQRIAC
ncbi:MAG: hypothetical protein FJY54_18175 [Betaproteobacteria bacterium]|nr:hypothetical protein [Betaproteobacteria bacterium]